ncbi:MAG: transglutaminase domain-containing protein [archaeon]
MGETKLPGKVFVFLVLLLLFLVSSLPPARAEASPDGYSSATISVSVSGRGQISESFNSLSYATTLFPKNDERQSVVCDRAILPDGTMKFSLGKGAAGPLEVRYSCTVKTGLVGARISGSEPYPLVGAIDPSFQMFLVSSEKVKVTPETVLLSKGLIGGATAEFEALARLAEFVNENITYNSSYFGFRLDSGEVLRTRQGVCEEFAHLFIALARSAGIPARYVGGFAWGGSGEKSFGSHGWAEAYFPGSGWVPFDPTTGFGQYGWLDASHVKFYSGEEAAQTVEQASCESVTGCRTLSWTGLLPTEPAFAVSSGTGAGEAASIESVAVVPSEIFAGAFSLANVTLKNNLDSAVFANPSPFYGSAGVGESERLSLAGQGAPAVLKPNGRKDWFFVVRAPEKIAGNYYYKYPVTASIGGAAFMTPAELTALPGRGALASILGNYARISGAPGRYYALGLDGGSEVPFEIPSGGILELPLVGFSGKVFLTTGNYLELPERSSLALSFSVPSAAYSDESAEAVIFSTEEVTAVYSGKEYKIPSGGGTIPLGTASEARVTVRLKNGTEESLTGTIRRIPKPDVSVPLPEEIPASGKLIGRPLARIANGRIVSESIDGFPERDGGYFVSGEPCGTVSIKYSVEYEDLAGRGGFLRGNSVARVSCGGSRLGEILRSFFAWLFGFGSNTTG